MQHTTVHEDFLWNEKLQYQSPKEALENLKKIVDSKTGIVRALVEAARRNDERKIFWYVAWMCNTSQFSDINVPRFTNGVSFNKDMAMIQALGEAVERYCLSVYRRTEFPVYSCNELGDQALDLNKVARFSKKQLGNEVFKVFMFDENTKFRWVKGYSLTQHRDIFIPAQLVYFFDYNYDLSRVGDEPIIRFPDTNGSAPWMTLAGAIRHGICEVVERDAMMITWLNKLPRDRVSIENSHNEYIINLCKIYEKYGFELYVYDITTDLPIPTMLSIVIDRSSIGPAVVVGTACNLDPEAAIIKSIEDAKVGPDLRDALLRNPNLDPNKISPMLAHGLFWWGSDKITNLDFLLKNGKRKEMESLKDLSSNDVTTDLKLMLRTFEEKNIEAAFVDVTTPDIFNELGFSVVKVIIPELHPIHLLEKFKYLGGNRLYQVPMTLGYKDREPREEELNRIPHPFT